MTKLKLCAATLACVTGVVNANLFAATPTRTAYCYPSTCAPVCTPNACTPRPIYYGSPAYGVPGYGTPAYGVGGGYSMPGPVYYGGGMGTPYLTTPAAPPVYSPAPINYPAVPGYSNPGTYPAQYVPYYGQPGYGIPFGSRNGNVASNTPSGSNANNPFYP